MCIRIKYTGREKRKNYSLSFLLLLAWQYDCDIVKKEAARKRPMPYSVCACVHIVFLKLVTGAAAAVAAVTALEVQFQKEIFASTNKLMSVHFSCFVVKIFFILLLILLTILSVNGFVVGVSLLLLYFLLFFSFCVCCYWCFCYSSNFFPFYFYFRSFSPSSVELRCFLTLSFLFLI